MTEDELMMKMALEEAKIAAHAGEVPVGCVIVRNGEVIVRTHNAVEATLQGTAHAELLAIQEASRILGMWRLDDCTLYVTKEPCAMCAGAMVNCRVPRLVFGCGDPKYGAAGGCVNVCNLPQALQKIQITSGVLEEECSQILREFFRNRRIQTEGNGKR